MNTCGMLLKLYRNKKINVEHLITHGQFYLHGRLILADTNVADFKFSEVLKAYDVFGRAAETGALKVHIEY